jgi:hypothetical protein
MKKRFCKLAATVLAFLIIVLPEALSARERRGATLEITLKDGHNVTGELIAVKTDSLLLLSGKDESIDIAGIRSIRIIRKSRAGSGALYGFLAGAMAGVVANANIGDYFRGSYIEAGAVFGGVGGLVGLGAGELAGIDKTIQFEGKSESEVMKALAYLRDKARIRDYK